MLKTSSRNRKTPFLVAAAALVLALASALAFTLVLPRAADAQQNSSKYVQTCNGGKIRLKGSELRFLRLHNKARRDRGIGYLCVNRDLTQAARGHSRDMMRYDYFKHASRNGDSPIDRMEAAGYSNWRYWGENISWGSGSQSSAESQFNALMNSPHHKENILKGEYKEIGIGTASGTFKGNQNAVTATMDFGARRGQPHKYPKVVSSSSTSAEGSAPGLYRDGTFYLKNAFSGGGADVKFRYGGDRKNTTPLMGDWNGDGTKTAGIHRGNSFYLKNSNQGGKANIEFRYGKASDQPIVGDWNGDGKDTIGIVRGNSFYLKNSNQGGGANIKLSYGKASDQPIVGDWNGDGKDTIGIVRGNSFYLKNSNQGGKADIKFRYGKASDTRVAGDWDGDGRDTAGLVRDGTWYLSNSASGGKADAKFSYGKPSDTPIVWKK